MQVPLVHESEAFGSQATHAAPPVPQVSVDGELQALPLQQPDRHVCEHPPQAPFTHASPPVHATHTAPPVPHALEEGDVHTSPLQHPFGQEAALHTQTPPTHAWPDGHADPDPQAHTPPVHELEAPGSQAAHAAPPVPHVPIEGALHVLPVQQPDAHVCEQPWHEPFAHALPPEHATHAAPPVPHAPGDGDVHTLPLQQPLGQELALHTHVLPTHACPEAHARPDPHVHWPLAQPSERPGSHAVQATPPTPHAPLVGTLQVVPLQQPAAHETASHTHAPPTQR